MPLANQLQRASFKGASFLLDSADTTSGRKSATFEFPNQDRRFVEDLGKLTKVFSIQGTITGPNYLSKRDALISALESSGSGQLVHPTFGTKTVFAKPYNLTEDLTALGEARFSMLFEETTQNIFPAATSNNIPQITALATQLLTSVNGDVGSVFNVTSSFIGNYVDSQTKLNDLSSLFDQQTKPFSSTEQFTNEFSGVLRDFNDNINTNIRNPSSLGDSIESLFISSDNLGATPRDKFNLATKFFDYGDDDVPFNIVTESQKERESNRKILNAAVQVSALSNAYRAASLISYSNNEELIEILKQLNVQFNKIIDNTNLTLATIDELNDLRTLFRIFYQKTELNISRVIEFTTQPTPLTVLTYQIYGDLDNFDDLVNLNNVNNPGLVEGTLKVLTD